MDINYTTNFPDLLLSYHVERRNNFYYIDEYYNKTGDKYSGCTRSFDAFKTKKHALTICGEFNQLATIINELKKV